MSKYLRTLSLFIIVIAATPALALPIISVKATPDRVNGLLPRNVMVEIDVSGMQSGDTNALLGGFQLDVKYDPDFLFAGGAGGSFGTALGNVTNSQEAIGIVDFSTLGTIHLYEVSLLESDLLQSLQKDAFRLATLSFITIPQPPSSFPGPGNTGNLTTSVIVNNIVLSDDLGNSLSIARPTAFDIITFVPEPSSSALFAVGLIAFGSIRLLALEHRWLFSWLFRVICG